MKENYGLKQIISKLYLLLDGKQKRNFIIIILIMIVSAVLSQLTPKAIGWLTDDILIQNQIDFLSVVPVLLLILAVNIANEFIKILRRVMVEDTATKTEKKAMGIVITSLLKAPLAFYKENMTGNIHGRLNRCLEGTIKLEKLVFMDFAPAIFNSAAAIIVIFTTLPVILALPMLLVIPIGIAIVFRQIDTQRGIRVELLKTKASMDGSIVELLNGIEVIRITDSISLEEDRFDRKCEFLRNKEMKHHVQMAKYDCLKFMNEAVFTVLMIGISAFLATKNVISVGAVLTSYLCFSQLIKPLEELHRILDELSESIVLAEDFFRMAEIPNDFSYGALITTAESPANDGAESLPCTAEPAADDGAEPLPCAAESPAAGSEALLPYAVQLRHVSFSYGKDSQAVLRDVSLSVEKGIFLGVAGPSGCGKSSLIKVLCKLEKCKGDILIDGKNILGLSRKEISSYISLVPQNPFIIAGTIYENICYGLDRQPTREEITEAVTKACLHEFIESLPDRLDTVLSEGGSNLSGGQKQRISIARIFLRKPKILILDEATSALDNTSERYIQNEIEKLKSENEMAIISVAHRLTTLKNSDRIIVMDEGKIVQTGVYRELIQREGIFRRMYEGKLK